MAAEAVFKVKQAEDSAREAIRAASEQAKEIIAEAGKEALARKKAILDESRNLRAKMIEQETATALQSCEELVRQGAAEREKILSPDPSRRGQAIDFIIERIVSVNGNN